MTAAAEGKDLWVVGGGDMAGQFAEAGRLDQIVVYIAPVTLGGGAAAAAAQARLRLEELAQHKALPTHATRSSVRPKYASTPGERE